MGGGFNYRFSIIPAGAVTDGRLKGRDLQVLCLLGRHTDRQGWCRRSQVKMALEIDCARATVQASLGRLYSAGWVERRVEELPSGADTAHSYRVLLDRNRSDPPADRSAPCHDPAPPAGSEAAPPADSEPAPLRTPVEGPLVEEDERERERRREDDEEAGERLFEAFLSVWPTVSIDDRARTRNAWNALGASDRGAAISGVTPFLDELKRHKRNHVPAGWRYLEERRWSLLDHAGPDGAGIQSFQCWSREWWAALLARVDRGERVAFMIQQATEKRDGVYSVRSEHMPPAEAVAALKGHPSDGEAAAAWRVWFDDHGARMPIWRDRVWLFLPSATPPTKGASMWPRSELGAGGVKSPRAFERGPVP